MSRICCYLFFPKIWFGSWFAGIKCQESVVTLFSYIKYIVLYSCFFFNFNIKDVLLPLFYVKYMLWFFTSEKFFESSRRSEPTNIYSSIVLRSHNPKELFYKTRPDPPSPQRAKRARPEAREASQKTFIRFFFSFLNGFSIVFD